MDFPGTSAAPYLLVYLHLCQNNQQDSICSSKWWCVSLHVIRCLPPHERQKNERREYAMPTRGIAQICMLEFVSFSFKWVKSVTHELDVSKPSLKWNYTSSRKPRCLATETQKQYGRFFGFLHGALRILREGVISPYRSVQLDCPSVIQWDTCHSFCCRGPILILRPDSEISAQTTRVNVLDFFVKPNNGISAFFTKRR